MGIADELADLPLVDQHCHPVVLEPLDRAAFELMLTEAHERGPDEFESQVGLAVRRWCAPELGLDPHAQPDAYLARRAAPVVCARARSRPARAARRLSGPAR